MIQIVPVTSSKHIKQFIKLPKVLPEQHPLWIAPLDMDMKKFLKPGKHPFHEYGTIDPFLAIKDGEVVGRIAAITNSLYGEHHDKETAFFGFFESINSQEVADALFDKAFAVVREKGFSVVHGPASPSSNYEFGLLTEGFDTPPKLMMAHNPEYYIDLIKNYGFAKEKGLYAFKIDRQYVYDNPKVLRVAELAKKRQGITSRKIDFKKMDREIQIIKDLYNRAWETNWGHVPMTERELDEMAKMLKPLAIKDFIFFLEKDGEPIAFSLCLPDYNYILKHLNGKLFPFGFIKLLTLRKEITWVRTLLLGVVPEHRGKGLDAVMFKEIIQAGDDNNKPYSEASWMLEDNDMINRGMFALGAVVYKKYTIFSKKL